MWKTSGGKKAISGEDAIIFNSLHKEKEVGTPRMGGLLVWITVVAIAFVFFILSLITSVFSNINLKHNVSPAPLCKLFITIKFSFFSEIYV